jgi:hypothetical protein
MNYAKPEIASLASASSVIQSGAGKNAMGKDGNDDGLVSIPAYEADE